MNHALFTGLVAAQLLLGAACEGPEAGAPGEAAEPDAAGPADATTTYHAHVRPLLEAHCVDCHRPGGIGPLELDSWEAVAPLASVVVEVVESGQMPPWTPDDACRPLQHSRALPPEAVQTFTAWRAAGFVEGSADTWVAPPAKPDPREGLGPADLQLEPAAPYVLDPGKAASEDEYRCLVLDHEFEETTLVKATDVAPGVASVVHHVAVFIIPPDARPDLEALDAGHEGPGYPCYGGPSVKSVGVLAGWTPGMAVNRFPEGAAFEVAAGARLVAQIHYNTASAGGLEQDLTALHLWTLDPSQWTHELRIRDYSHFQIEIPAGDPEVVEVTTAPLAWEGQIVGALPHMHLLGTAIRVEHLPAEPGAESACVIDVPRWDFNWQQLYHLSPEAFVEVHPDDELRLSCEFDNSAANQPILAGARAEPADVVWGEGTQDEMCLTYLALMRPVGAEDEGMCPGIADCLRECPDDDLPCGLACVGTSSGVCTSCVADALLNACAAAACPDEGAALQACLETCEGDNEVACALTECTLETNAVWACVDGPMREGACDTSLAACDLSFAE